MNTPHLLFINVHKYTKIYTNMCGHVVFLDSNDQFLAHRGKTNGIETYIFVFH